MGILWATVVVVVWPIVSVQCCVHCWATSDHRSWKFALLGLSGFMALALLVIATAGGERWSVVLGLCAPVYILGWKTQLERVVATGLGTFRPR